MSLRDLQRALQREILGEDGASSGAIVDAPPLPVSARLAIYRNAYQVRLIEALADTYHALHELLGDETFSSLGELYVAAHPSTHRSIRWYGAELAHFLSRCAPFAEQPILAELARFEWTLRAVFDAADCAPLERSALERIAPVRWPDLALRFHPSLRRLSLDWNTVAVWQALGDEREPPLPARSLEPVPWLLWRQDLKNYFRSLDGAEDAALVAALSRGTFTQICAAMRPHLSEENIPPRAAGLIGTWADSGMIVGHE